MEYWCPEYAKSVDRSIRFKLFFRHFPEEGYGEKIEKFSGAFRRTVVVRPKNIVGSLETSYFVENCLLYKSTSFKQKFIAGL